MKRAPLIEILYTDECPFWKEVVKLVEEVNRELKTEAIIKKLKIANEQDAKKLRFPGSPTIRINGVDIDPEAKEAKAFIGCRIYRYNNRLHESPPKEMIKKAFQRILK
jgi:glutaredoxin